MSDHIKKYKERLKNNGNDTGEAYANNTMAFIDATFHASPSFNVVEVMSSHRTEITKIDTRIVEVERMGSLREVLFRPKQYLDIGTYIKFDGDYWIVSDLWGNKEFTSRALVQRCNHELKWATSPYWKNDSGKVLSFPCLASQSPIGSKATQGKNDIAFNRYDVMLPEGQLLVYAEYNDETKDIRLNQRFIFGDNVYEIYGIDNASMTDGKGIGIVQLLAKLTTKKDTDDFENKVAFNNEQGNVDDGISIANDEERGRIW